jgi:hypothetical protein
MRLILSAMSSCKRNGLRESLKEQVIRNILGSPKLPREKRYFNTTAEAYEFYLFGLAYLKKTPQ